MPVQYGGDRITFSDGSTVGSGWSGFKNRIINGAMVIDQRNAGASVTPNVAYTLDRWQLINSQTSKFTVQQDAGAVTPPVGFTDYLGITSTSAYSITSGDYYFLRQRIEGFNVSDLAWGTANASPVSLSFWVRSSLTGTFGGSLVNGGDSRSYPFSYTISAANTWEQKSITIAGDTTGTWFTNNSIGIAVNFGFGVGSTFSGTAGAWAAGNFVSATGATSVVGTNGATLYITGVQLEKGSTATSFDYRPYGTELQLCQRYYSNLLLSGTYAYIAQAMSSSEARTQAIQFKVSMRATPTITLASAGSSSGQIAFLQSNNSYTGTIGTHSAVAINYDQFIVIGSGYSSTGWSAGTATSFYASGPTTVWQSSAEL
jgi:hypothetical protein